MEEIDKNNDRKRSQPLPVKNAGFRLGTSQEKGPDDHLESIVGTSEDIKAILSQRKDAYAVTWSPDGTVVAFVVGDTQGMEGQMYLWFSGDQRPKLISGITDRICDFYWSPDSQYVFVDTGTSAQRGGIIVSVEQHKEIGRIGYTHRPQWSPDSKMVALGVVRKVEPPIPWELDGTIDLALYNVETGELNVVATGTNEVYYYPVKWDRDGTLTYEKHFINNEKVERLKYKK
ncbi:hypothetical protein SY88_17425 [Clostridiales bacterium PH28_bin88]|nr:hypothetical protein SY88_17425 [Clostridiales bacterium PH28_bin88]